MLSQVIIKLQLQKELKNNILWLIYQKKMVKTINCEKSTLFAKFVTKRNSHETFTLSVQISRGFVVQNSYKNIKNKSHLLRGLSILRYTCFFFVKKVNKTFMFEKYVRGLSLHGYPSKCGYYGMVLLSILGKYRQFVLSFIKYSVIFIFNLNFYCMLCESAILQCISM